MDSGKKHENGKKPSCKKCIFLTNIIFAVDNHHIPAIVLVRLLYYKKKLYENKYVECRQDNKVFGCMRADHAIFHTPYFSRYRHGIIDSSSGIPCYQLYRFLSLLLVIWTQGHQALKSLNHDQLLQENIQKSADGRHR